LTGDVFRMDAKEEPPWMGSRRAPAKLYGAFSRRMLKSRLNSIQTNTTVWLVLNPLKWIKQENCNN